MTDLDLNKKIYHSTQVWKKASTLCLNPVPTPSSEICTRILKSNATAKGRRTTSMYSTLKVTQQFKKGTEKYYSKQTKCNVL